MNADMSRVWEYKLRATRRLRGIGWTLWIRAWGGNVGHALEVDARARLRHPPTSGLRLGDRVYIGVGAIVDVHPGARLVVGNDVKIMQYTVIAASEQIEVGDLTQLAEFSSVRDSDHGLSLSGPIRDQLATAPVSIGIDVWIARGVAVLKGVSIGDGAVVGANAVVRADVPERAIAAGVPARVIRLRE